MMSSIKFKLVVAIAGAALMTLICGHLTQAVFAADSGSEAFGIYTANLNGDNLKPLITSSWQQMTHARVSPDKQWITFTRYNNPGKDLFATENEENYYQKGQQYHGTEVMIMRVDGSQVKTLIPHLKDRVAANSNWTPDGKGIIYVSNQEHKDKPQINHVILNDDMGIDSIYKIPIPDHIIPTDPHWVGDWIVFTGIDTEDGAGGIPRRGIWRIRYNGEDLELLAATPPFPYMQDNDPKLSPDGSQVAFMRKMAEGIWHTLVVDVETKQLKDLSLGHIPQDAKVALEAVPSWSGDGELLIFDRIILYNSGEWLNEIYTMRPDGSGRRKLPFSRKYTYFHPSFFPGEGSGDDVRIIFSTRRTSIGSYEKINIIYNNDNGEAPNKGVFDPALEYNEDGSVGWMVYSGLEQPLDKIDSPFPKYIHTHLARTLNNGGTWEFRKCLNESKKDTVVIDSSIDPRITLMAKLNNGRIAGIWHHEVPTLVHDPDDPGREWKLFWHKYFSVENPGGGKRIRVMEYSWIMYKYAKSPEMLDTAESVELLGTDIVLIPARYSVNRMPELEDSIYCSEPGSLYKDGILYLSFDSGRAMNPYSHKQILLSSKDHGDTWVYINKLTDHADAMSIPYVENIVCPALLASALAEDQGRLFLLSSRGTSRGHRGTCIFEFEDITQGKLKRDPSNGGLIIHKLLLPSIMPPRNNAGESDYDEHNIYCGIIMPQGDPNSFPRMGQIFNTKQRIVEDNDYEKINIIGETALNGVGDLSLEYEEDGEAGWMAYSSVDAPKYIRTHLARTLDHGKTWNFIKRINESPDGIVFLDGKPIVGSWWNEVPTLVHDPDDPGKEWKLFWHKYFATHIPSLGAGNRVLQYSWIAYKYASDPAGEWSDEIPLFGAGPFPLWPYKANINLNALHPDLNDFITYTEPGSIYKDGVLYLSLQGHKFVDIDGSGVKVNIAKIILLASHDHGQTWNYLGTLLENDDAKKFDAEMFSASSLVEENDRVFLFAAPLDSSQYFETAKHKGTVIFEFEDISQGRLKRDENGELTVVKYLKTTVSSGGQSDYDEQNTYGGIVMPQLNFTAYPEVFQIFNTKEKVVNAYTITATAGEGGTITPSGTVTVNSGDDQSFTITADAGYQSVGAVSSYTFSNVTRDHTIQASFAVNAYTITATAGAGGSITPSGSVTVEEGNALTFTIAADSRYICRCSLKLYF
ncbi:MAG: hypothetical protein JRI96_15205 [Deltaproteobacteria bacterium]|nr:hypothetical protein [Deltaproteobacteria bacterium]